jgi:CrcB protein
VGANVRLGGSELAAVFAGGCAGALVRVALAEALPADAGQWPWATFLANVAGALALGYVAARVRERRRLLLLGSGLCGALTTFSALQLELLLMLDGEHYALAAGYAAASVAAGLAAVTLGTRVDRKRAP